MIHYTIRTGQACHKCHRDYWIVRAGHNQCQCGQYLWVERTGEPHLVSRTGKYEVATRFRYHQGLNIPTGYPGIAEVTKHSAQALSKGFSFPVPTERARGLLGV